MDIIFSNHAIKRSEQRGISHEAVDIVIKYGSMYYAGDGCIVYWLSERDVKKIRILYNERIEAYKNISVLLSNDESIIITIMHTNKPPKYWEHIA